MVRLEVLSALKKNAMTSGFEPATYQNRPQKLCNFVSDKHSQHFGFRSGGHDIFIGVPHVHAYCPVHCVRFVA
jgi:hypothetical protein